MSKDPIIPGAKLIEQGLAALPAQARLEVEIRELRAKVAELDAKVRERDEKIALLTDKPEIAAHAAKVLKHFYDTNAHFSAQGIASALGLKEGDAEYHIGVLVEKGFLEPSGLAMHGNPAFYIITHAGRGFIGKHGMA